MRQPVPFGKYLLLDRISVGGMAEVFRAKNFGVEGFEKLLAIKRILPSMADDREFLRMFVDEAKIAGQLSHPSIAQIYELGREGSAPYIAMEYVWGKDLLQIYNRFRKLGERMPTTLVCHVISKACEGLDYAHRKRDPLGQPLQIVHRDCSPQNILVNYEGEVKIIDFGIAKAASRVSQTNAGVLKGKFAYLSPEQVRGTDVDRRSDLFALGTVFFECLTGERLFHSESDFSTLERVRDADVPRPREVCADLPEEVERIVLRALAKDPADRYQHGSEMFRDLQAYLRSQEHPYTASTLGAWIRRAFPQEMQRERQLLERYRRIGPDGTARASAPPLPGNLDAEVILSSSHSPGGQPTDGHTSHQGSDASDAELAAGDDPLLEPPEAGGDPTLMGGPDLADLDPDDLGASPFGRRAGAAPAGDFGDDGPTEVHGEIGIGPDGGTHGPTAGDAGRAGPAPDHLAGPAASLHDDDIEDLSDELEADTERDEPASRGAPDQPATAQQAKTLLGPGAPPVARGPSQSPHAPRRENGPAAGLPKRAQAPLGVAGEKEATASIRLGMGQVETTAKGQRFARGTLMRDVAIGVGIAVGVLGAVLVAYVVFGSGEDGTGGGQLDVDVGDVEAGEVRVDGEVVGDAGAARVIVDAIEPGPRVVEVKRDGEVLCAREIDVYPGATSSLACTPPSSRPAALVLEHTTDEHEVRVSGRTLDVDPTSEAIELESGKEQQIEVLHGEDVVAEFEITPAPGELVRRSVDAGSGAEENDDDDDSPLDAEAGGEASGARPERSVREGPRSAAGDHRAGSRGDPRGAEPGDGPSLPTLTDLRADDGPAEEPEQGYLVARTEPWARIYVDGEDTELMTPIAPRSRLPLEPGVRRLTFVVGDESFTYEVRIEPGATYELTKTLPVD